MLYLNGYPVPITVFPDKTSQVWKLREESFNNIEPSAIDWYFEDDAEIFRLVQLVELVRAKSKNMQVHLRVGYLPYARQDKEYGNESTFALRSFAKLLNVLNFTRIEVLDVHSNVATELIGGLVNVTGASRIQKAAYGEVKAETIIFPDQGACDRYFGDYHLFNDRKHIVGQKERDQSTGAITGYYLANKTMIEDPVLVVDDICDGGATFVALAQELKRQGVEDFNLYVTHGLFSKGVNRLFDAGYKRIFTYEGEQQWED